MTTQASAKDQVARLLTLVPYLHAHGEVRLDERNLGEMLGVSRTPIREALTVLEHEGFVRSVPRRGVFVAAPRTAAPG